MDDRAAAPGRDQVVAHAPHRAQLDGGALGSAEVAVEWYRDAMRWYEKAETMRPAGNDEAILRWNTCVRMLERYEKAPVVQEYEPVLDD